jgi:hypothetical protein
MRCCSCADLLSLITFFEDSMSAPAAAHGVSEKLSLHCCHDPNDACVAWYFNGHEQKGLAAPILRYRSIRLSHNRAALWLD